MIVLFDVLELDSEAAKHRMLTTCRWILRGALAEAVKPSPRRSRRTTHSAKRESAAAVGPDATEAHTP